MSMPPIYFYIPPHLWPETMPTHSNENWSGFGLGIYAWTVQTYLRLQEMGVSCDLTHQLPNHGIVFFHSNAMRKVDTDALQPGPFRLLICLKAEAPFCSFAQLHVVQNPCEASPSLGFHFMPHWPQPGLIPRALNRGDCFENIAFLGHQNSLDKAFETPDWATQLAQGGFRWTPIINTNSWDNYTTLNNQWNDYRHIDAVIAIRKLSVKRPRYRNKPATKLYNAWLANVPAILGREMAYRAAGKSGVNYLEANSLDTVLDHLKQLKRSTTLRHSLVEAGRIQSLAYQPTVITQRWTRFLKTIAVPVYQRWCTLTQRQQQVSLTKSGMINICDRILRRIAT